MGLLDEAIREHLELKRLRGADPSEVLRQEREVLGGAGQSDYDDRSGSVRVLAAGKEPNAEQEQTRIEAPLGVGQEISTHEEPVHDEAHRGATGESGSADSAPPRDEPQDQVDAALSTGDGQAVAEQQQGSTEPEAEAAPRQSPVQHLGSTADFETAEVDMSALLAERDDASLVSPESLDAPEGMNQPAGHLRDREVIPESEDDLLDERLAAREERLKSFERGIRGRTEKRHRRPWRS